MRAIPNRRQCAAHVQQRRKGHHRVLDMLLYGDTYQLLYMMLYGDTYQLLYILVGVEGVLWRWQVRGVKPQLFVQVRQIHTCSSYLFLHNFGLGLWLRLSLTTARLFAHQLSWIARSFGWPSLTIGGNLNVRDGRWNAVKYEGRMHSPP